ncbi:hypothetical protein GCM10022225_83350 [Plantactinospora mayteni]|uniref:Uncharacterized protein n=1 Tax=Plantactinospora mayteni TaxID=566021 RepID=A0ABQ4F4E2_9ACTN|nr:DUF6333 family protein [Plantactinospora mayteni]GIH01758.1 hypothetical protein Pma05_83300 [Plantactinospora mayteni]
MSLDRATKCRHSITQITRVHPPPPALYTYRTIDQAPAHDSARARAIVRELPTVAGVEELAPVPRRDVRSPTTFDDLDYVTVGCWGGVVQITDPAFGEDGVCSYNLDPVFDGQVKAHPDARIIGACEMDFSLTYGKYLVHVPGAPDVSADGWDEMTVSGNLAELLRACGIDPARPGAEGLDFDDPDGLNWGEYLNLIACGLYIPLSNETLMVSVFKVSRPEDTQENIEEVWYPERPAGRSIDGVVAGPSGQV